MPKIANNYQSLPLTPCPQLRSAKEEGGCRLLRYIPDGGSRTVIFGCMLLNGALLLLIRSFSAAMLMLAKKRYFAMLGLVKLLCICCRRWRGGASIIRSLFMERLVCL